ncbi:MAG: hypothetical protein AAF702_25030 [Chloroflexota bacterium]
MNLRTKLDHWCECIIEAGWLAALIVAPMFFNVFSSRVFEPDKISLVRSIALIMLLAWLVKIANGGALWLPALAKGEVDKAPPDPSDEAVQPTKRSLAQQIWQTPFLFPVLFLVFAYLLSTSTSVARFVSWWGSYQRLQGTYTFLSYVIIASLTAAHLRNSLQLQRLQHTIIITSLPIAIYGVIQHYGIDPLPWGGDVQVRIAANAGNAIFLAAYLIMAVFLTIERIYNSFAYLLSSNEQVNEDERQDMPTALAGGAYLFVFMVQLLAIFWTQSRGPWLGLLLGLYLFVLLLFSALRPRNYLALILGWVGIGIAGIALIVLMNATPLFDSIRYVPYIGRFTNLLNQESTTAQVRILIWQGAADMSQPHEPLIFPDSSEDSVNALRPLVGYGPEAMWIAYNPFYPPNLAHVEKRNASPDRAHNETWDSLVITGLFGFVAYMALFISIFYWGLRWLGLIRTRFDKMLFSILLAIGGIGLFIIFYIVDDQQLRFFGVALPAGLMAGLVFYIMIAAFIHAGDQPDQSDTPRMLLIIALLTTIVAHFVEIHFGIAIAATRTYFWIETAMLLCLGMRWLQPMAFSAVQNELLVGDEASQDEANKDLNSSQKSGRSQRRSGRQKNQGRRSSRNPRNQALAPSRLATTVFPDLLVFMTFIFIYTTNSQGKRDSFSVLWSSITSRTESGEVLSSPALLFLMIFTWLVAALLGMAASSLRQKKAPDLGWWIGGIGLHALVVWGGWLVYGLIQGSRLVPVNTAQIPAGTDSLTYQLERVAGHFALYTWLMVIWLFITATVYAWPILKRNIKSTERGLVSVAVGAVLAVCIFFVIGNVNIGLVRADIVYKQGQQFDSQRNWINSIELYRRALSARQTEDHYMLFLGRSLLEQAKQAPDEGQFQLGASPDFDDVLALEPFQINAMSKVELLRAAEVVLTRAQEVNPLNTDHTANLARLYRTWADLITDGDERAKQLERSLDAYEMAVTLSPNAAHLWNEKGNAYLAQNEREQALEIYEHSLSIDQLYAQTYLLLADYYNREQNFQKIVDILEPGVEALDASRRHRPTVQMLSFLAVAQARLGLLEDAIETSERIVEMQPNNIGTIRNLVVLNRDLEDHVKSAEWAEHGLSILTPDKVDDIVQFRQLAIEAYRTLGQQEQVIQQYELMRQVAPDNTQILQQLYALYQEQGQSEKVIETLQALNEANAGNYQYPLELARRFLESGQRDSAQDYAEQALQLAPEEQKATIEQLIETIGSE